MIDKEIISILVAEKIGRQIGKGFEPYINPDSTLLILNYGNNKQSYARGFYYGHERNKFWQILAKSFSLSTPNSIDEKKMVLKSTKIALYNIVLGCKINLEKPEKERLEDWWKLSLNGSEPCYIDDITNIYDIADIKSLISNYPIKKVIANGKDTYELFIDKFPELDDMCIWLPSTNPIVDSNLNTDIWITTLRELQADYIG